MDSKDKQKESYKHLKRITEAFTKVWESSIEGRKIPKAVTSLDSDGGYNLTYYDIKASSFYTVDFKGIVTNKESDNIFDIKEPKDLFALATTIISEIADIPKEELTIPKL